MSVRITSEASGTDWDRLKDLPDDEIVADDVPYDPNDPDAVAAFWDGAEITLEGEKTRTQRHPGGRGLQESPPTVPTTIRLSPEVLKYFRATGEGWQTRIDAALKEWIRAH